MKQKLILLTIAMLATTIATAQNTDTVQLPYTANFTQGWTANGGATIISNDSVRLNGNGQKIVSPSIFVPDSARLYFCWVLRRDNPDGSTSYMQLNDSVDFQCRIASVDRYSNIQLDRTYIGYYDDLQSRYAGQTIQIEFEYTDSDTTPIYLTSVILFQYDIQASFEAPAFAYIGDTVEFIPQVSVPAGDTVDDIWWYYRNDAGSWLYGGEEDTLRLSWSTPGTYNIELGANKHNVYAGKEAAVWFYSSITIFDTTTVDCDSISLPYSADFTQCWTAEGGATIIDPYHVSLTSQGQKLTGPWMESAPGNSFFHFVYHCDDNHEWNSNQTVRITLENEDGVIVSWVDQIGNWGGRYRFDSPGGPIRASFEYTGSQSCNEFVVSDVAVYSYQIDVRLEAPAIATAGDTITLTAHATLQNGDMPDSYSWYMYDANWNYYWLSPESGNLGTVATVLSCSDSNLVMVINTTGRYPITTNIYKNMVYNNHDAYDDDWMYINIIDQSIYQEDSIYYTSAAKDTVIGCHPQLHVANLPEGVTVIADSAFFNHGSLSSVTLPHSLTHIGKCAFALTNGFSEITIPENVIFVGDNAFWSCLGLNTVNFNATNCQTMSPTTDENSTFYPVFIGCKNLTTINIGENVTRIPDRAFSNCSGLRGTLTIPDAVTYIGTSAFYHWDESNTDPLVIVIGQSVNEIGNWAFFCHSHVRSVTSRNPIPPAIHENTFSYLSSLTVPCGSVEAYHTAEHWSQIPHIQDTCGNETGIPVLNVNNINTTVYPLGYLGYDGSVTNFLVNGSQQSTLFANGLWIGSGEHTAIRQFGSSGDDFQPGPLSNDGQPVGGNDYNRVWIVSRDMIDNHLAHYTEPGYTPAESIRTWPAEDANVGHSLAPYHDANNDGHYNPLDGDYPLIRGDKAAFSIFNDAGTHGESGGQALGVEVHCMTYAFHEPADTAMMNTVFVHYDIYNRSSNTYENTYVGMWSDFDIGYAHDDYMGCDVSQGMYYAYNGDENDGPGAGSFNGGIPPSQGCVILGGPWQQPDGLDNPSIDNEAWHFTPGDTLGNQAINGLGFGNSIVDDERMGMTNFTYYENSTSSINGAPSQAGHFYNYLRSTWQNGQHVKYGRNGINYGTSDLDCSYMFPGDSDPWHWGTDGSVPNVNPDDWNEVTVGNAPGDRRGLGSCGPFTFQPSATETECQQLDVAYVTGWSQTTVSQAVENLKRNVASVRRQFVLNTTDSGRPFLYQPSTIGIADIADTQSLLVYPNPTTGLLNVVLNDGESGEVKLFDMMGRTLLSQHVEGSAVLDLHTLPQGVYMVKIGNSIAQKILIIK